MNREKLELIYNSINDAREIIKMLDLKANFLIFFIIIIIGGLLKLENKLFIIKIEIIFGFLIVFFLFLFVIKARFSPKEIENCLIDDMKKIFFPIGIKDLNKYHKVFKTIKNINVIEEILLYERLKLQVILEKKIKYFNFIIEILFPIFIVVLIFIILNL